tara:strand:- start:22850 stop:24334 length:1485 start_codon:yes stop_codon:yes gene_type:complete
MQKTKAQRIWQVLEDSEPGSGGGYEVPGLSHEAFLFDERPTLLASGGERGSKSHTSAMKGVLITLDFIAKHPDKASGAVAWLVAESYELTRPEFEYMTEWLLAIVPGTKATNQVDPGAIDVPVPGGGAFTIKTRSANDPKSLRAEAPVFTLLCEAALVRQDVYFRLLGRAAQSRAQFPGFGQLIMSGTFENSLGWYPTLWTKWQSQAAQAEDNARSHAFPSHENRFIYPGGLQNPELVAIKAQLPEDVWKERHLAIPAPPSGRVFGSFDVTKHVQKTKYNPELPVYLGIDPGYSGRSSTYAVEVVQPHENDQYHVIDEIAVNKISTPGFTVRDICEMVRNKYWWGNDEIIGVIDVGGTQHNNAQESNVEVWQKETGLYLSYQKVDILPGIDRMKSMLSINPLTNEPNLIIDPKCKLVISELGGAPNPFDGQTHVYSYKMDTTGQLVSSKPHDDYCDGIKALTYLFINKLGYATGRGLRKNIGVTRRRRRIAASI